MVLEQWYRAVTNYKNFRTKIFPSIFYMKTFFLIIIISQSIFLTFLALKAETNIIFAQRIIVTSKFTFLFYNDMLKTKVHKTI